ncbi:MAG TPA: hypothetical protein ENK91_12540 [Bacteroidetes bacterium]|nr:hypothetical protein [Bacteroidota bacterium]
MIYKFLRWYTRWGIKFFYRNVFVFHKEKVDFNKAAIIASNHPAGFYESIILTTILPKPVHFLVRSDYVNIYFLKWFFNIIKLLPIYRQSEGVKNLSKNQEVFDMINDELRNNSLIGIYPEGSTKYQFKVSSIKKGISRMIANALKESIQPVRVVPIGFNFSDLTSFRSFLNVYSNGQLNFYKNDISSDNINKDLRNITRQIEDKLKDVNIDLDEKDKQEVFKTVQTLLINEEISSYKVKSYEFNSQLPERLVKLSKKMNLMEHTEFEALKGETYIYSELLNKYKMSDSAVRSNKVNFINILSIVIGLPVFLIGFLMNILPVVPAVFIVRRYTKEIEYKAVLLVLLSQFLYFFYFILIICLALLWLNVWGLIVLISPFLAWYSVRYYDLISDVIQSWRFNSLQKKEDILTQRKKVMNLLSEIS